MDVIDFTDYAALAGKMPYADRRARDMMASCREAFKKFSCALPDVQVAALVDYGEGGAVLEIALVWRWLKEVSTVSGLILLDDNERAQQLMMRAIENTWHRLAHAMLTRAP